MDRRKFLKSGIFTTGAIISSSSLLFAFERNEISEAKLIMPNSNIIHNSIIVDKSEAMWVGWLARLVVSSLVTALGAKIVDALTSDCYCNETGCYKSEREYTNAKGIYGYSTTRNRFVTQKIEDYSIGFDNMSVPFLTSYNSRFCNIEGPFLAGICKATETLSQHNSKNSVRKAITPIREISNGGHRFDKNCRKTNYETDYGRTEMQYVTKSYGGDINVVVKDTRGTLALDQTTALYV